MNVRNSLSAYAVLGAIAAAFSTTALAQEEQGAELEEIVVTGSYLFNAADSPSPVTSFDGELINCLAAANMATFLF